MSDPRTVTNSARSRLVAFRALTDYVRGTDRKWGGILGSGLISGQDRPLLHKGGGSCPDIRSRQVGCCQTTSPFPTSGTIYTPGENPSLCRLPLFCFLPIGRRQMGKRQMQTNHHFMYLLSGSGQQGGPPAAAEKKQSCQDQFSNHVHLPQYTLGLPIGGRFRSHDVMYQSSRSSYY